MQRRTFLHGAGAGGCAALLALAGQSLRAADAALPERLASAVPSAQLLGQGRLRYFGFHVYDARLWGEPSFEPDRYGQHPFALELTYARAFAGRDIAERSLQEMRRGGPIDASLADRWLQAMTEAFPDVAAGDRLLGVHTPGRGAVFHHNAGPARRIDDAAFSERFFGIWLASWTSDARLRDALMGERLAGTGAR